ncbi:ABC transporter ATP-binding protein [Mangrovimonas cancribranchiae]|uniref:ABC transporter ATP-binding protein n=1 Tax=Mangrovimonas cancribranchiae TaxID=3080055 RepID=A0AAU6P1B2_9FLAO
MTEQEHNIQPNNDILVKVEGLSKKFCKDLKTSLWYGVKDLVSGVQGNQHERELRPKEFWAVKDVSFELRRGECLGLIGHNGAGKSTLLKMLNGLINPDAGKITIKGKVGALIELGAGFNPILSGRENIYNNGAILGFSRKEIDEKVEAIIDFAEIREFIDMPVQHYSSGMKVRLGFAVAAQMEPDVLIIDEVLAVGDTGFKIKCYNKISELSTKSAIIFVSHSMQQIARICTNALLMHKGNVEIYTEDVSKGIQEYDQMFTGLQQSLIVGDKIKVNQINLNNTLLDSEVADNTFNLEYNESLIISFDISFLNIDLKENIKFSLVISDKSQRAIAVSSKTFVSKKMIKENRSIFNIKIDKLILASGVYSLTLNITSSEERERIVVGRILYFVDIIVVGEKNESYAPIILNANWN